MAVMESACAAVAEKASMAKVSFNFMIQSLLLNNGHPCLVLTETQGRFGQMCLFQRTDTNVRSRDRSRGRTQPRTAGAPRITRHSGPIVAKIPPIHRNCAAFVHNDCTHEPIGVM
jgi:hypothetical protein